MGKLRGAEHGKQYSYSARNVFLILYQMPTATRVAGYTTWQKLGDPACSIAAKADDRMTVPQGGNELRSGESNPVWRKINTGRAAPPAGPRASGSGPLARFSGVRDVNCLGLQAVEPRCVRGFL